MKSIRRLSWILLVVLTILIPNTAYAISGIDCLPAVTITEDDIDTAFVTMIDMTEGTESTESLRAEIDSLHQDIIDRGYEYLLPQGYNSMRIVLDQESLENLLITLQGIEQQIEEIEVEKASGILVANISEMVPSPGGGWCARYVSLCYYYAGFSYLYGDANDLYYKYCIYSDTAMAQPGMIIAVARHSHTTLGRIYGHCGIIIEKDGQLFVRHNTGTIEVWPLQEWINYYGDIFMPKFGWGW